MKRIFLFLSVVSLLTIGLALFGWAQDKSDTASIIENGKHFLTWMKDQVARLELQLDMARREKNAKKINCIEDRLASLKELATESDGLYQKLRAFSLQQRVFEANKVYAKLQANQRLAQQMIKLVDACYHSINEAGGFTETLEQWLGEPPTDDNQTDPTASRPRPGIVQPAPLAFTPNPVSAER